MAVPILSPDEITPAWLTAVLFESGHLPQGQVLAIKAAVVETPASEARRLVLECSQDVAKSLPRRVFIKFNQRHSEIDFFQMIAPNTKGINLLPALAFEYWPEQNTGFILFPDVSDRYMLVNEEHDLVEEKVYEQIVATLARLHAQWWDHPKLRGEVGAVAEDVFGFAFGIAQQAFDEFVVVAALSQSQQDFYKRLLSVWPFPALAARLHSGQHLTLVHGDVHFENVMFARHTAQVEPLLIDWAVWHINLGVNDIAYLIAFGPPEWRLLYEVQLVTSYYQHLAVQGVSGYSYEQCWQDYRMAALAQMVWPVFWWKFDIPEAIWRETLVHGWAACRDLGLGDLLP